MMTIKRTYLPCTFATLLLAGASLPITSHAEQVSGESANVTWSCTGSPCPWGDSTSNPALIWPQASNALASRYGYTVSGGIYLPASVANGTTIRIDSGAATLYAGRPDAGHRALVTISAGGSQVVSGLGNDEVLSVQADSNFAYTITFVEPSGGPDPAPEPNEPPDPSDTHSQLVTWNCTSSPCPWGTSTTGQALVWPAEAEATAIRLGYTVSHGIYLPASVANGAIVWVNSGSATLYAGQPDAGSHVPLAMLSGGAFYEITNLAAGEVLSVQGDSSFSYAIALPEPPEQPPETDPNASKLVTWNCTSSPCPWGVSTTGQALVWPQTMNPVDARFGYTVSDGIYLPAAAANGITVRIDSGTATLYAGPPQGSHSAITTLSAGQSYVVGGLHEGDVLSVQSESSFTHAIVPADHTDPGEHPVEGAVKSVRAYWRCNTPNCNSADWVSEVIAWPSWAAYSSNNRSGDSSRTVYSSAGDVLHPYMGSWAHGCEVKAESGMVLIIEWERGTDTWRETWLNAGDTHTINLQAPEDGAMIETYDFGPSFSVSLNNCTPQPLP